jgi:hypothetical protein
MYDALGLFVVVHGDGDVDVTREARLRSRTNGEPADKGSSHTQLLKLVGRPGGCVDTPRVGRAFAAIGSRYQVRPVVDPATSARTTRRSRDRSPADASCAGFVA